MELTSPAREPVNSHLKYLNVSAAQKTQRLILLGASGSVGTSTTDFLEARANEADIRLVAFSVHSSYHRLLQLLDLYQSGHAAITDEAVYDSSIEELQTLFPLTHFYRGKAGVLEMIEAATSEGADTVLTAVVGATGIEATMLSLKLGLKVALANKETMVTAGPAIQELVTRLRTQGVFPSILPVDSEHNAIFQLLVGLPDGHLDRILLTASGGPFRELPLDRLLHVTKDEVLNHPTWSMGPKITVDSASMINKGLEVIEAHFLFDVDYDRLDVRIHPDSIVHGMISTHDGGYLLCASQPHMVFPIAHALFYPESVPVPHSFARPPEDWPAISFERVDERRYPGFVLALKAGQAGGTAPAVFNAANEEAVSAFLAGRIHFTRIADLIQAALDAADFPSGTELELFLEADAWARRYIGEQLEK